MKSEKDEKPNEEINSDENEKLVQMDENDQPVRLEKYVLPDEFKEKKHE